MCTVASAVHILGHDDMVRFHSEISDLIENQWLVILNMILTYLHHNNQNQFTVT